MHNTGQQPEKIPNHPPTNHNSGQPVNYRQNPQNQPLHTARPININPEQDRTTTKPKKTKRFSGLFSLVQLIGGAFILALIINKFIFHPYQVFGSSMNNSLYEGDRLIISKIEKSISYIIGDYVPSRGEIIVFRNPVNPDVQLIKRVIALPGERVAVVDGKITVYNNKHPDGFNPDIPYIKHLNLPRTGHIETIVGEDSVFVAGDNRAPGASLDSRNDLGNIPTENIVGELVLRILPLSNASFF